jgi:signal transduction histidine kinase
LKLTRKLILALVVVIFGIMTADAVLQLRREIALFEEDMSLDETAMGQAVRVAVETAATDRGIAEAQAIVDRIRASEDRVDLRWVWVDAGKNLDDDARTRLEAGQVVRILRDDPQKGERQFTYVPLRLGGERAAALELSEPLRPQRLFLRSTELQILGTLVVLVIVCALVALGLGVTFVGRPLRALALQARRIGAGNLSERVRLQRRDEIGDLARELDTMCDQLADAHEQIRSEAEGRIAALEQLRHADRLKTVGQLASGVAHELGTPLNVVGGRAKLIASGALAGDEVTSSAKIIAEQSDRMTAIIRQLLDFARRRAVRPTTGDLRAIVTRTVDMLAVFARTHRVTITLEAADQPMPLRADHNQLEQALANVLVNGIQAMPRGGPLHVRVGPAETVSERGRPGASYWSVVVEDRGVGIAADHLARVFEPFFTTKDVGEGTGLGLAVAHGMVAEHGGWIDVTSIHGHGTRFEIFLEATSEGQQEAV